jgi:putative sigma-54 modulation protein
MQITVTFRHVDASPALREYAEDKITKVTKKYLRRPVDAHVILAVSKQSHTAEITLHADHHPLFAKETTPDLYSAIDLAVAKLEHQAQKLKTKRATRKGGQTARASMPPDLDGATPRPKVYTRTMAPRTMSIESAVTRLERSDDEVLVFINDATQRLAVAYRRKDGSYGLVKPSGV